ncbi:hypothetical protein C8F01DRAFT_1157473, partial [Mycena amicta]
MMDDSEYDLGGLDSETFVWDHRIYRNLFLAGLVVLIYDHLLVFSEEVKFVWSRKLWPSTWWYLLVRYTSLLCNAVGIVFYFGPLEKESCAKMEHVLEGLLVWQEGLVQATLFFRVLAMYGRSMWLRVLGPIWVVANLNLGLGIWTIVEYGHPRMLTAPGITGCHTAIPRQTGLRLGGTWISQMISDTMVFGLTVYRAYQEQAVVSLVQGSLIGRMARDGAIYFGIIVLANLANVLTCFLGDIMIAGLLSWWTTSLSVVLILRLILNLQAMAAVSARTEDFDSTEMQGIHFVTPPQSPQGLATLDIEMGALDGEVEGVSSQSHGSAERPTALEI